MDSRKSDDIGRDMRRFSGLGIDLVANTLVGLGLGYLFDRWLGTSPWLMIIGLVLGTIAGFKTIFRILAEQDEEDHQP